MLSFILAQARQSVGEIFQEDYFRTVLKLLDFSSQSIAIRDIKMDCVTVEDLVQ
jgi:hypothetical protein